MTVLEAINEADRVRPNQYTQADKVGWLSQLDGTVKEEIINTHAGGDEVPFTGYTGSTSTGTTLLVPEPFCGLYIHFLLSKVDFNNAEFKRYNNDMAMFNIGYAEYAAFYNRKNKPLQSIRISL